MKYDARRNDRQTTGWDWNKGQELRALRLKKNIRSQEKFAEYVGVDTKTIGRWERGEYDIRYTNVFTYKRLCAILGDEFAALLDSLEEGPFLYSAGWYRGCRTEREERGRAIRRNPPRGRGDASE